MQLPGSTLVPWRRTVFRLSHSDFRTGGSTVFQFLPTAIAISKQKVVIRWSLERERLLLQFSRARELPIRRNRKFGGYGGAARGLVVQQVLAGL